ncbi:MAG: (5-formylfuran-3-yl)methyl phosphate synthase [Gammaproteobacteria bacterium]|nr:(5-formylfuran-3-yl)methyl phosphate synthase [Gammaproteobacteria bacterium]
MTGFLASVDNLEDAITVSEHGADIIDLKDPSQGALGGLTINAIHDIVDHLWEKSIVSATVGDLDADVSLILEQIGNVADTGVDYVKVGMFSQEHIDKCLPTFEYHARRGIRIIAVLFADIDFDIHETVKMCKKAHLTGVMMDTAGKHAGSLLLHREMNELSSFIQTAKNLGLLTGLAGSLREKDIETLLPINPDYIGFRTALCKDLKRTERISAESVNRIRSLIPSTLKAANLG